MEKSQDPYAEATAKDQFEALPICDVVAAENRQFNVVIRANGLLINREPLDWQVAQQLAYRPEIPGDT